MSITIRKTDDTEPSATPPPVVEWDPNQITGHYTARTSLTMKMAVHPYHDETIQSMFARDQQYRRLLHRRATYRNRKGRSAVRRLKQLSIA